VTETSTDQGGRGRRGFVRQSSTTSVAAALAILAGLLLDVAIASRFGAGPRSDAFFVGARIPLSLNVFLLSGATQALVPAFSLWLVDKGEQEMGRLVSLVLTAVVMVGAGVALLVAAVAGPLMHATAPGLGDQAAQLAGSVARVMFVVVPLVGAAEVLRAYLNARYSSTLPAAMNVVMNGTAAILVLALGTDRVLVVACAYVAGAAAQLVFMWVLARRRGFRYRPGHAFREPAVAAVGRLSVRPLLASGLQLLARLGEQLLVSFLPAGSITILNYGNRLTLAVGGSVFFRSVILALLPRLTAAAARGKEAEFAEIARTGVRVMLAIALPLTALMVVLGKPGALLLFRRGSFSRSDAVLLGWVLSLYALSLVGAALQRALLATFFARLETKPQLRNTIYGVVANLVLILPLVALLGTEHRYALLAVPVAYAVAQGVNVGHAWYLMRTRLGISLTGLGQYCRRVLLVSLTAMAAMAAASALVDLDARLPRTALLVRSVAVAAVGVLVFSAALWAVAGRELRRSWRALRPGRQAGQAGA
jgi:murein biosynthesis integral membrane protein MurJ